MYQLTEMERRAMLEILYAAIVEVEECEDISQGVEDGLLEAVEMLGGSYEK